MESLRNSDCWYIKSCNEDCDRCVIYTQLKWQMDNSGLYLSQQKPIELFIDEQNSVDRQAYKALGKIRNHITEFVDEHRNLYICSREVGNGKTSWAIKMLHTYFHYRAKGNYENLLGMFVNTTDLLLRFKDFNNPVSQKYKDDLENVDLVVFDDIAVTSNISQYDYTQLFNIINKRNMAQKSTIYTSNITEYSELEKLLGPRLATRIYDSSEVIELKGAGRR